MPEPSLDELRTWYADRCEAESIRRIAVAAEVDKNTLQQFVAGGTKPHSRIQRRLAAYYSAARAQEAASPRAAPAAEVPAAAAEPQPRVSLEELRSWFAAQSEVESIRHIARATGISDTALRSFVSGGTKPISRVRRRLELYYTRVRAQPPPRAELADDWKAEPPYPGADLNAIREHAAMRVRESSLRALAATIPLKRGTLYTFITKPEREPQDRTRATLVEWYYREMDNGQDAAGALGILSRFVVGPEAQRELRNDLLDAMERAIREAGREVPAWVAEMRK